MNFVCPIPITNSSKILLGHGSGGKLMNRLLDERIFSALGNEYLDARHDGASLPVDAGRLAFSSDSFVVHPLFFPGGNIGELSVNGTVNDLAMCGAEPKWLSLSLIIEEGLETELLEAIIRSVGNAAKAAGVQIVTGDTKVVEKGKGHGLFINTSGIGIIPDGISMAAANIREGDHVLINAPIAAHGMAIMAVREGLEFESPIQSDTRPLNHLVKKLVTADPKIHVMRDATRGGLSSSLNELLSDAGLTVTLDEPSIPLDEAVAAACELLGFDPLYVANEGVFVTICSPDTSERLLEIMRNTPEGSQAAHIGTVGKLAEAPVLLKTSIGSRRVVDLLSGDQLPRIC